MRINPQSLTSYLVQSESNPSTWYLVDIACYWGCGKCDCPDFRIRMEPELRKGKPAHRGAWMCKHIRVCKEKIAAELLDRFLEAAWQEELKNQESA